MLRAVVQLDVIRLESLLPVLDAAGLTALQQLELLAALGGNPEPALPGILVHLADLQARAALLAVLLEEGWPAARIREGCLASGLHPISVAAQIRGPGSAQRAAERLGVPRTVQAWVREGDGLLRVDTPGLRRLPGGLTAPAGIQVANQPGMRQLGRFPGCRNVSLEAVGLIRLDLRGMVLGDLSIRNCDQLREVHLPAHAGLRLAACEVLRHLDLHGDVVGDLDVQACPRLERIGLPRWIGGSLRLQDLASLSGLGGRPRVGRGIALRGLPALRSLPEGLGCPGCFEGEALASLRRMGSLDGPCTSFHLRDVPRLAHLPTGLVILEVLELARVRSLRSIPGNVQVGMGLRIEDCEALEGFAAGFHAPGRVGLWRCPSLRNLPVRETPFEELRCSELPGLEDPAGDIGEAPTMPEREGA